ncbi:M23 family metallopeptidase [Lactococcus lactis]|uniref:Enterolysin A n=1 Tax=Lactococcus lactis subsp. lactis TaxID=1360 RepID=A0A0V8DWW7_LACLL|nr:M23 family metallopeptidase [Lactococcus lactis]KSU18119.1 Enterolysin A [Lactococcus lactis subsp. lactis]
MANDWGWPFSGGYKGYEEGQQFGMTTYDRTGNGDYFHDGFDFGSARYPGSNIAAVHAGTVVYAGWAPAGYGALGTVVVTKDSNGYYVVYQEFGTSISNINVSVGQSVTLGQVIGTRNTSHLHLGITKKEWLSAQSSAFKDDGTWLDPINIIQNGTGTVVPEVKGEIDMYLIQIVTDNKWYVSNGTDVRYLKTPRVRDYYLNTLKLPVDRMYQIELNNEFGSAATDPNRYPNN